MRTLSRAVEILLIAAICVIPFAAAAQAPDTITYQGKLTDDEGRPITVATDVTFTIYDSPSGGSVLYTTTTTITPDMNGIFTVELEPIGVAVFDGSPRYLGIKVGPDEEMMPRQLISSTPYSLKVRNMPGIGSNYGSTSYITLTSTDINLTTVTVDIPEAGFVVVIASAYYVPLHVSGTKDLGRFSISRTSASLDYSYLANISTAANAPTDSDQPLPVSLHRTEAVSAGSVTYYFVADAYTGSPRVSKARLTVMYFPLSYGSVISQLAPAGREAAIDETSETRDSGNPEGWDRR